SDSSLTQTKAQGRTSRSSLPRQHASRQKKRTAVRKNLPVTGRTVDLPEHANIFSTTNAKGQISYVNGQFVQISGFSEAVLIGQPHNVVRHPDMPPEAFAQMWATLKRGRSWMGLIKNRCKNGDHYWVSAFVTP